MKEKGREKKDEENVGKQRRRAVAVAVAIPIPKPRRRRAFFLQHCKRSIFTVS